MEPYKANKSIQIDKDHAQQKSLDKYNLIVLEPNVYIPKTFRITNKIFKQQPDSQELELESENEDDKKFKIIEILPIKHYTNYSP